MDLSDVLGEKPNPALAIITELLLEMPEQGDWSDEQHAEGTAGAILSRLAAKDIHVAPIPDPGWKELQALALEPNPHQSPAFLRDWDELGAIIRNSNAGVGFAPRDPLMLIAMFQAAALVAAFIDDLEIPPSIAHLFLSAYVQDVVRDIVS